MSPSTDANTSALVLSNVSNSITTLTLNRPEKLNSFNQEMAGQLLQGLNVAESDSNVRAILIAANGKAFCAGQDLAEVTPKAGQNLDLGSIVERFYNPIVEAIVSARKPIIAAVNGVAAGAGANLALACDFVIAGESSFFIQAFSKVGLIPDSGGTFFLPRLVGLARAKRMTMLGEKISAAQLLELGAIYKSVPDNDLLPAAFELAKTLALGATHALAETKKLLNNSFSNNLSAQLALERDAQASCGRTSDYLIGLEAFAARKPAIFSGK